MKSKKFHIYSVILFTLATGQTSCGGDEATFRGGDENLVARYRTSIYSKPGSVEKGDWVASLEKGEELKVDELVAPAGVDADVIDRNKLIAHVKLADGKTGYIERKHLAKSAAVILREDIHLYKRPSITSPSADNEKKIKRGMIVFLEDEEYNNGDWIEISGGSWRDKSNFKGWVRKETDIVSTDAMMVVSAIRLEQCIAELKSNKEEVRNRSIEELKSLADSSGSPISDIARETLQSINNHDSGSSSFSE